MIPRFRSITVCAGVGGLLLAGAGTATATVDSSTYHYSQVSLKISTTACANLSVNSMTNKRVLLGAEYCSTYPRSRGFIKHGSKLREFSAPATNVDTDPAGISNNAKYIVLDTEVNYGAKKKSYLLEHGKYHRLADPKAGKDGTEVEAVNNHREIVGSYFTGTGDKHWKPFIWRHGKFHAFRLRTKGAHNVAIIDVNDHGVVSGYYQDKHHRYHGFWQKGSHRAHVINAPGAGHGKNLGTQVLAYTNNGTYCGNVLQHHGAATSSTLDGFVHRAGGYTSMLLPGSWGGHDASADTCDNAGDVAGNYIYNYGASWIREGFLATR